MKPQLPAMALVLLLVGAAFIALPSRAQSLDGSLLGTVVDSSGARITGADLTLSQPQTSLQRHAKTDRQGEFRFEPLQPGRYQLLAHAAGFADAVMEVEVNISSMPMISLTLSPQPIHQAVEVRGQAARLQNSSIDAGNSSEKTIITIQELEKLPLAHRSFANIAYLAPMTEPVEPSDPTKARITAVSFAGSSGLNVDLSVDGGDNNDDYIGGFLQNYSPDAIQEFAVRTAQFEADASRTNGGSVILSTRRGTNDWHGSASLYVRDTGLNARNNLDNPAPNPKQPFSRENGVATLGGPIRHDKIWFFASLEYVNEDASVAYSGASLAQFQALAQLAGQGLIPGLSSIAVPTSVGVPFRDTLFSTRFDWAQSSRSQWFLRGALDRNHTKNDLLQQATLPSTGAFTRSNYYSVLVNHQYQFSPAWLGSLTLQASGFDHSKERNSHLGLALAFPFSATFHTASGFETFGDNQFITPLTAFPIHRAQQKYQLRYDLSHTAGDHAVRFGVNAIHEPVLGGALASDPEYLVIFVKDPSFYLSNTQQFQEDFQCAPGATPNTKCISSPAGNGRFSQNVQRLGAYLEDSWRMRPLLTVNYGIRYDTTFGLFIAEGRDQSQNPGLKTLENLGLLASGIPHDYRKSIAPRLGIAYAPGSSARTVIRGGVGLYYNDLAQSGWVNAFQAVNNLPQAPLQAGQQGAIISPRYHSPYALQASAGAERSFGNSWLLCVHYEHHQGVHQFRRYEYVSGFTLPSDAPNVSLFKTDNRSSYNGLTFQLQHRFSSRFELMAHYTLASATTWGATVGELFDYVNGVTDPRNAFGSGDHGPSGEDVRHRAVIAGVFDAPFGFEISTLSQFESARPFTMTTPVDLNGDGLSTNDRAVVNGVATTLDQFRGLPFIQVDLRVSRPIRISERVTFRPFLEFFNLFNRLNPGNNYVTDLSALPTPVNSLSNATAFCLNPSCSLTRPITSLAQLRVPAGAVGDFFGPGTTVGIPFAAQLGFRLTF